MEVAYFSGFGRIIRRLYFAHFSLIVRFSCIFPLSKVKGRCKEKNFLRKRLGRLGGNKLANEQISQLKNE